ncbi:Iron only hydrogenase large subunitC-terminal domain containing protein [Aphelenchoides avenae]|nr:Iron only hydrogenase large subunitC-terminal domain containing protein [Aphelenchus avenae]
MAGFSGIVRITNVNDFIEPSKKCILPAQGAKMDNERAGLVNIRRKGADDGPEKTKKVKVTLSDCLACSGCVTTAETVLMESQTTAEMLDGFKKYKMSFVTVSPQSLCALAVDRGVSASEMARRVSASLKARGATYVMDSNVARVISRKLHYKEFRKQVVEDRQKPMLLTGVCPGFMAYAEKTQRQLLTPFLSRVRSPQAIAGRLVKDYFARKLNVDPKEVFHVCIMPCYDKKLESSRPEFELGEGVREVDCVVTTTELNDIIKDDLADDAINAASTEPNSPRTLLNLFENGILCGDSDSSLSATTSGGYSAYVQHSAVEGLDPSGTDAQPSVERDRKGADMEVTTVRTFPNEALKFATVYGFRNIQNLVRKAKRKDFVAQFVEVMACPSGCGNGGGQIRGSTTEERAATTELIREEYTKIQPYPEHCQSSLDELMTDWAHLNPDFERLFT